MGPQNPVEFVLLPLSSLLVRLPGVGNVLMDTGFGQNAMIGPQPLLTVGRLASSLAAAGIDPADVNAVLISHMHPDHIGGLYDQQGNKAFPNASYHIAAEELAFWSQDPLDLSFTNAPPPLQAHVADAAKRVLECGRNDFQTFKAGEDALPGIGSISLPGHAPAQVGFILSSGAETMLFTADAITNPVTSIQTPEVHSATDMNKDLAQETRHRLIALLLENGWQNFTTHFPWPSIGRVTSKNEQTIWEPRV